MPSVKNILLEFESAKDENFSFIDDEVILKVTGLDFDTTKNFVSIEFDTTYNKTFTLYFPLNGFQKWLESYLKQNDDTTFKAFLKQFFSSATEDTKEDLDEVIDDSNEVMANDDMPNNATNTMVGGADQTMDLEKVFKKSMPKSVRNYSGNLGLGTVVW